MSKYLGHDLELVQDDNCGVICTRDPCHIIGKKFVFAGFIRRTACLCGLNLRDRGTGHFGINAEDLVEILENHIKDPNFTLYIFGNTVLVAQMNSKVQYKVVDFFELDFLEVPEGF